MIGLEFHNFRHRNWCDIFRFFVVKSITNHIKHCQGYQLIKRKKYIKPVEKGCKELLSFICCQNKTNLSKQDHKVNGHE